VISKFIIIDDRFYRKQAKNLASTFFLFYGSIAKYPTILQIEFFQAWEKSLKS